MVCLFVVRRMSTNDSNIELIGIASWEKFCERKSEESIGKFVVAVDQSTNNIVGTIELLVFGKYKTVNLENGDIGEQRISMEIKVIYCYICLLFVVHFAILGLKVIA